MNSSKHIMFHGEPHESNDNIVKLREIVRQFNSDEREVLDGESITAIKRLKILTNESKFKIKTAPTPEKKLVLHEMLFQQITLLLNKIKLI